jgi:hypothetical protein
MHNIVGRYSAFVASRRAVTATATRAPIVFSREEHDQMQNIIERYYAFVRSLSGGGDIDLLTVTNAMTDRRVVAPPT